MNRLQQTMRVGTALILVLIACPAPLAAQEAPPDRLWVTGGLGLAFIRHSAPGSALHVSGHLGYKRGKHVLMGRASQAAELFDEGLWDVGLLYGWARDSGRGQQSLLAGASLVRSDVCPSVTRCSNGYTVGIPIVARASIEPTMFLGLGLEISGNLNPLNSYWAGALTLRLGPLR